MAKVFFPLFSRDARGDFAKQMIYRRGGVVTKYFVPRDPKSAAQLAQRAYMRSFYMAALTQAQADLLYSAIGHDHDDAYSLLEHVHDHGSLSGLGDDDHGQYHTDARGDARYPVKDSEENLTLGKTYEVGDDTVTSFITPSANGVLQVGGLNNAASMAFYFWGAFRHTSNVALQAYMKGTNVDVATGALSGTSGTDGKFTISVHTDGKIYLENRTGANRYFRVRVL